MQRRRQFTRVILGAHHLLLPGVYPAPGRS
jgi:hypothetical protein